jgi:protein-tyrosine phosphatase
LVGTAGIGAEQLWRHGHDYILPVRFLTIVPGRVFRGAWQKPWPMRRIVHDHKIKTVVALAHPADHYLVVQERKLAAELGVKWVHIPIVDHRGTSDRAAEEAISDLLEQAAAIVADPNNQPVYFHCHHGLNRTSMVQIAYRTKYCGWTLAQAADEIERTVGLVKVNHGPDYRHMVSFYENRVLPLRDQHSEVSPDVAAKLTTAVEAPTPVSTTR